MPNGSRPGSLHATSALLPEGIASDVLLTWDENGWITQVTPAATARPGDARAGFVVPGVANLHSHAFQRAMAGLTERRGPPEAARDSFWTWRDVMYRFVAGVTPDLVEAIAGFLYAELLEQGFTSVAEFHYLHHQADGTAYANIAEMALRHVAAARAAGIGMTMLPVLYRFGGIFEVPANPGQRPFLNDPDAYFRIIDAVRDAVAHDPDAAWGFAAHSLRGCGPADLATLAQSARTLDVPIHIHAAEQVKEVQECIAATRNRPVRWLIENTGIDARWCLVHATNLDATEVLDLAASGAVAGLCPTTEANLGDGIFALRPYLNAGGCFGFGTDSHIATSVSGELRTLEYSERLVLRERAVGASDSQRSVGMTLLQGGLAGGAQAVGRKLGRLAPGYRADLVALDTGHPSLVGRQGEAVIDSWVFAGDSNPVEAVWVGGRQVVEGGRHLKREALLGAFAGAMRQLAGTL
ncbi:MAG: formimidoylglutamate deiminase [Acetobacteraceae bacterium]|nr:formimidoylglutamate deiminase [Acetobacteraceae bacterium]